MNSLLGKRYAATYQVQLKIHDLTDVPLNTGKLYVKWKWHENGRSESGFTAHREVADNEVIWEQAYEYRVDIYVTRKTKLAEDHILRLSVRQETKGGKSHSRIGVVLINHTEFLSTNQSTQRHLLKESRVNSSLKVTIKMQHVSGDPSMFVLPLTPEDMNSMGQSSHRGGDSRKSVDLDYANEDRGPLRAQKIRPTSRPMSTTLQNPISASRMDDADDIVRAIVGEQGIDVSMSEEEWEDAPTSSRKSGTNA